MFGMFGMTELHSNIQTFKHSNIRKFAEGGECGLGGHPLGQPFWGIPLTPFGVNTKCVWGGHQTLLGLTLNDLGVYPKRVRGKTPKGLGVIPQKECSKRAFPCQLGTMEDLLGTNARTIPCTTQSRNRE